MFRWIRKHKIIMALTSVVLVLCIIISVSYFRGTGKAGSKVAGFSNSVFEPVTDAAYSIRDWFDSLVNFRKTMHENERLTEEIRSLKQELMSEKLSRKDLEELRSLTGALNY